MANSYPPLNLVLQSSDNEEPWIINQRIFHILNTYLQPNATFSPTKAAQEIDKLFGQERKIERTKNRKAFCSRCGESLSLWQSRSLGTILNRSD